MTSIPFSFAKKTGILVTEINTKQAKIIYCQKPQVTHFIELRRYLGLPLQCKSLPEEMFNQALMKHYVTDTDTAMQIAEDFGEDLDLMDLIDKLPITEDLLENQHEAPIIRLLNALLNEAVKVRASDLHIETFEQSLVVRFRIDGLLHEALEPPRILAPLIISRIKVMAKLDIAEKRLPQDGRMSLRIGGRIIDVRVSIIPTHHGERIVLRLLDKQNTTLSLAELGMAEKTFQYMKKLIQYPHGMILITGPTGSGKTTSLYAILAALNNRKCNILTVEDPIEYDIHGIGQTQVNHKINMTFAKGLRAILRQDPDVVMIGEIRDAETAQIAMQASLTGHLVLSTLHTNHAIGAITRLHDMGIAPFLLSSTLIGIVAQRLVRLLCSICKKGKQANVEECELLKTTDLIIYYPTGCEQCQHTGYRGRSGIYELIIIDQTLQMMIHDKVPESTLQQYTCQYFHNLQQDGFRRVIAGETSLEEILRLTSEFL